MSDRLELCQRLVGEALEKSEVARILLDAIKISSAGREKVEIECVECDDDSRHVAFYDRSRDRPSVL